MFQSLCKFVRHNKLFGLNINIQIPIENPVKRMFSTKKHSTAVYPVSPLTLKCRFEKKSIFIYSLFLCVLCFPSLND